MNFMQRNDNKTVTYPIIANEAQRRTKFLENSSSGVSGFIRGSALGFIVPKLKRCCSSSPCPTSVTKYQIAILNYCYTKFNY